MRIPSWISQHGAAVRAVLVFTVITGLLYPAFILGIAQLPGLSDKAGGSIVEVNGRPVGSSLIGQSFLDAQGNPVKKYFQSRPSATYEFEYNTDGTAASNLGPESIEGKEALLTMVCARSKAVGELEGVDGARPYCTKGGVGAVLRVFYSEGLKGKALRAVSVNELCPATPFLAAHEGVTVECAQPGGDYTGGVLVPVRGDAAESPAVPADAVTASGSGLDPHISVAYAKLQAPRVARERGLPLDEVLKLIGAHTTARFLGFMGEPAVSVLELNVALDRE